MSEKPDLSPEAFGVLSALTYLRRIRQGDPVVNELVLLGLAELNGSQVTVTRKGRLLKRVVDGRIAATLRERRRPRTGRPLH